MPEARRSDVLLTGSTNICKLKLAVIDFAASIVAVQVAPEAASHPPQSANSDPVAACAVRVTTVPFEYGAVHLLFAIDAWRTRGDCAAAITCLAYLEGHPRPRFV